MRHLYAASSLVIGLMLAAQARAEIKLDNVCVQELPGYTYSRSKIADFHLINAARQGERFKIYVGYNPQLKGQNRIFSTRAYVKMHVLEKVTLGQEQAGEVLGLPRSIDHKFFHIMVDRGVPDYNDIVRSVANCD